MEKLSNIIHPTNIKDCNLTIVSNDLPLITYNRAGSKSSQELLYEVCHTSSFLFQIKEKKSFVFLSFAIGCI